MLYEIDKSCLALLETGQSEYILFFEELAIDRRKCKNLIVASKEVLESLSKMEAFSNVVREVYKILGNRRTEFKLLRNSVKRYCRIVAEGDKEVIKNEQGQEIIKLPLTKVAGADFTEKVIFLAENRDDILFYKVLGRHYMKKKRIGVVNVDFECQGGGGSTIGVTLAEHIRDEKRFCLCIVDSDRKCEQDSPGSTMQGVSDVIEGIPQVLFEAILLEIHEIENLIPFGILDKIIEVKNLDEQGLKFLKYLIMKDSTKTSPALFFDLKKGIQKKSYFLNPEATEEQKRKYRKMENFRLYWKNYIEDFGVKLDENLEGETIVSGICEKVLKDTLKIFDEIQQEGGVGRIEPDPHLIELWDQIGEKIFCWGCVGNRIAV